MASLSKTITKELIMSSYTCDGYVYNQDKEVVYSFEVDYYRYPASECEPPEEEYNEYDIDNAIEMVKACEGAGHYEVWVDNFLWSEFDIEDDVE